LCQLRGRKPHALFHHRLEARPPVHFAQGHLHRFRLARKTMRLDDPVEQILIDVHRHFHAILGMAFRRDAQGIFKNLLISNSLKIRRCETESPYR
jgi:hypothetical protein